jgi:thiamine-phosphate pyrophosphorylase
MSQLFLITPTIEDGASFLPHLSRALASAPVASLLLRVAGVDDRARQKIAKPIAAIVQERGVAALVDGQDPRFAAHLQADGFQLSFELKALDRALDSLQPERIVGVGGLRSKDDAMLAGESNADYLMFGEPDVDGKLPTLDWTLDRCRWWAEIFNTPAVGYAPDLPSVEAIAQTGIEFVALGPWAFGGDIETTLQAAAKAAKG